jgi:hypothetical protein
MNMNKSGLILWTARVIAALIMLQTLYFKFTASEESVYIFSVVGMEPWGRIGVGIMELIASVLLLLPATGWLGALIALGLMAGAIGMHLTLLGIVVKDDGGQLFIYAVVVSICAAYTLWKTRSQVPMFLQKKLPALFQ